ncbi:AsmA family protein [Massilia sp. P8910]|uniref:AsmA family protein n=1 Tax=Massilia antarctica TaxID=2765360 RepID=UPI001E45A318|nr:AsmA family protein [Massilia antarctica]MCE3605767.1 AsmA family protein [Massilia antarctica]
MQARIRIAVIALGATVLVLGSALGILAARFDPTAYKSAIVERVREKTHRTLAIGGDIRLAVYPRLGLHLGKASLSELGGTGEFAALDSVRLSFALVPLLLRQEVVVDRIELRGMRATVVRQADGSMNIDDLTAARSKTGEGAGAAGNGGAGPARIRFAVDSIRVDNAHLRFDDRKAARVVDIARLNIDSGPIAHGVPSRVALSANIGVDKPALNTVLIFESGFSLDRDTRRVAMTELDANLDLSSRAGIESRAKLKGSIEIDFGKEAIAAALKGKIDDSAVSGKGALRDGMLQLDIDIDRLDLARYLPRAAAPGAVAADTGPVADQPIDLSALARLRASGTLQVGELTAGGLRAANVHAVLLADAGKTSIKPLSATLYGGNGIGALSLDFTDDTSKPRMALVQDLRGVSLGALLFDASGKTPLTGRGDVRLDLATQGTSTMALREALGGTAALRLRDGVIGGIDLGRLVREAKAAAGVGSGAESTGFSELSATFRIDGGVARSTDLSASTPLLRIGGEGQVDLAHETIDARLRCTVAASPGGQDGPAAATLGGLTVPVALSGPLAQMTWQVDVAALSSEAAQKMPAAMPSGAKEKLKDRVTKDRGTKDRVTKDRVAKDRVTTDRGAKDRVTKDRVATDRGAKDRAKDVLGGLFPR